MSDKARPSGAAVVLGIHHFTVRCSSTELASVRGFYCDVLGMTEGPRPNFGFPGHWLYIGDVALLHLAAILPDRPSRTAEGRTAERGTSGFDHVSLAGVELDAARKLLADRGIPFEELPVPGWPLWQIFLRDPVGSKIELTFNLGQT